MCLQTCSVLFYSLGHNNVTAPNIIILLHCAPILQCNMAHTTLLTCDLWPSVVHVGYIWLVILAKYGQIDMFQLKLSLTTNFRGNTPNKSVKNTYFRHTLELGAVTLLWPPSTGWNVTANESLCPNLSQYVYTSWPFSWSNGWFMTK